MIKFSDRLKLVTLYNRWLSEVRHSNSFAITNCPESFIVFLMQEGFLNENAVKDAVKQIHETHVEVNGDGQIES